MKGKQWKKGGIVRVMRHTLTGKNRRIGKDKFGHLENDRPVNLNGLLLIEKVKKQLGDFGSFLFGLTSPKSRCFLTCRELLRGHQSCITALNEFDFHDLNGTNPFDKVRRIAHWYADEHEISINEAFLEIPEARPIIKRQAKRALANVLAAVRWMPKENYLVVTHAGTIEMFPAMVRGDRKPALLPYMKECESIDFRILYRHRGRKLEVLLEFLKENRIDQ